MTHRKYSVSLLSVLQTSAQYCTYESASCDQTFALINFIY